MLSSSDLHFLPVGVTSSPYSLCRQEYKQQKEVSAVFRNIRPLQTVILIVPNQVCFCLLCGARNALGLRGAEAGGEWKDSALPSTREEALGLPGASVLHYNWAVFILAFLINI